jgi:hypothetical protein
MRRSSVNDREAERALKFRQCPQCDYDFATHTGTRGCDLYACPYLPEALDTSCPTCNYNFVSGEGRPECSDPPSCEFAREEAPRRVSAMRRWLGSD